MQPSRIRWLCLICALPMLLALYGYYQSVHDHGPYGTMVISSYWASGHALATGANPYAWLPETYSGYIGNRLVGDLNLNPPIFLPFCQLLALAPLMQSAMAFIALSAVLFVAAILFVADRANAPALKLAWALLLPLFADSIAMGQNYIVLFLPAVAVWRLLDLGRNDAAAAVLGFVIAFKPNFALLLPIVFIAGHYRFALQAAASAAACLLLPVALYGPQIYVQWLGAMRETFHLVRPAAMSLTSWFTMLGLPLAGYGAAALTGLGGFVAAWKFRPDLPRALVCGYLLSLLCSPLAWMHYAMVLVPFLMTRKWNPALTLGALMLLMPIDLLGRPGTDNMLGIAVAWLYFPLVAGLLLLGTFQPARSKAGADLSPPMRANRPDDPGNAAPLPAKA